MAIGDKQNVLNLDGIHIEFHPKPLKGELLIQLWGRGERGASYKINFTVGIGWIQYLARGLKGAYRNTAKTIELLGSEFSRNNSGE